ncbi:MAG: AmmeMemoRadiSam system radical SAM enzyme [Tractidigestivibacter sp.]|jgi:pyruvate formate lyase activating enzyme|uniref:AmmeMemoRadiSam system radical SAM enzyme n=1 Tax=Tractidigestivibacter sp. TaxID=2847320 RepID=UPI003D9108D6
MSSADVADTDALTCDVCPHHCKIRTGGLGFCRARTVRDGQIVPENYGRVTSIAVNPIEKKPIAEWHPGSKVLSVGSYGCNMRCPFCQNYEISQVGADMVGFGWQDIAPEELVATGVRLAEDDPSMIGLAYTYNEPLIGWEYVRDCSTLAHKSGLANVLVSNGCAQEWVVEALAPLLDAANIDLKCFSREGYASLGGNFDAVKATIQRLAELPTCHLEVTTLIVPGISDSKKDMRKISRWLADLDPEIVLHVTRFFPRWRMSSGRPTPVATVRELAEVASESLEHVHVGNCW